MKLEVVASSSDGNFYIVTGQNGYRILIECGIPFPAIQKALNYDLTRIDGCLITHEHGDHACSSGKLMAAGVNAYGSNGTGAAIGAAGERRWHTLKAGAIKRFDSGMAVYPFPVEHDAAEPFGYIIRDVDGEHLFFATDTATIKQNFPIAFDLIAVECSYEKDRLARLVADGTVNETHARRLIESHMEKETLFEWLDTVDLSQCRHIYIIHAGSTTGINSTKEIEERYFIPTTQI